MTKRRDRNRKQARRTEQLDPKPIMLIVCEGEVTEREYFHGFRNWCENPRVRIDCKKAGVPLSVVELARYLKKEAEENAEKQKDENLKYDSVWAVFDVDEHPNITKAIQIARDNSIGLAVSNPSFELWLLLHFQDQPGMKDRKVVRKLLKDYVDRYDKHVNFSDDFQKGYQDAVKRAKKLTDCDLATCNPGENPSTGVYKITESIRQN